MCTLVILRRPDHAWPLLVAGNRDEMRARPWLPPARHWSDRADVVAGQDLVAGGSWFGVNDHGVIAAVMNRVGTLGPEVGKRSRGELVLEALDHAEASQAAQALADIDPGAYRAFNLFVGDPVSAFWLRHRDDAPKRVEVIEVRPGLHMLTARDLDDESLARIRLHLPRFRAAGTPRPEAGDWTAWQALLADRAYAEHDGPYAALNLDLPNEFGTVCSQLAAVPRYPGRDARPVLLFAPGPPDRVPYQTIAVD
jgi:uncharacterized protein with NRDE domain